ncbi:exopolysaccharide biosynthesis protein [Cognatiyoonia sp. IB215182]|uniref:exopolysaccharide biosynthesis protein n=1 Tax=Cognatiyoonia sp. IB215182 TaxID=3097353 RepID=UPI002A0BFD44|nr:exopolysaccharide biosynthesis protein [Cognatiyoonia sp. IB215182]MDX8353904.1 exopolysaccharide biosynthesis protein [Cognatiyoonia sp. IB215182]
MAADKEQVSVAQILKILGARGHGPIILTLAGLMMLPTGMLPFMPSIIGILISLTAFEMLVGGQGVSVPGRVGRIMINAQMLRAGLDRAAPIFDRLGRLMHPRAQFLVHNKLALTAIAVVLLMISGTMIIVGAIPGLPFILCVPVLLFGLGLTAGDGVVVALALVACIGAGLGVAWLL